MKRTTATSIQTILADPRVLRAMKDDRAWYSAVGVVQVLTESEHPEEYWHDLKLREPSLATLAEPIEFLADEEQQVATTTDGLDLDGVLRLVQSISSPRAERIKRWLIESARQRMEESENPELALLRARKLYEHRGYSRRWIEKRLRGVSARHELTGEWYRRGARESDDYRSLTNELFRSAFGMDVQMYRRHKGLAGRSDNLRDHMTDLELALTTLAETTAAVLHRDRRSEGVEKLHGDAHDAGQIVAGTVSDIERAIGKSVVHPSGPAQAVDPDDSDALEEAHSR